VIIGHVVESEAAIYCCTPCALSAQAKGIDTGVDEAPA
jgi:hypothetical protein